MQRFCWRKSTLATALATPSKHTQNMDINLTTFPLLILRLNGELTVGSLAKAENSD